MIQVSCLDQALLAKTSQSGQSPFCDATELCLKCSIRTLLASIQIPMLLLFQDGPKHVSMPRNTFRSLHAELSAGLYVYVARKSAVFGACPAHWSGHLVADSPTVPSRLIRRARLQACALKVVGQDQTLSCQQEMRQSDKDFLARDKNTLSPTEQNM